MSEKPKSTTRDHLRPTAQVLKDLDSSEPSKRERAIEECWDLAPYVGAVLAALLRGLNDPDEVVRLKAFKGLPRAFPSAEEILIKLLSPARERGPKSPLGGNQPGDYNPAPSSSGFVWHDALWIVGRS